MENIKLWDSNKAKETIGKRRYFWVNRKDLVAESDVANWAQMFDKCDPEKQRKQTRINT